MKYDVIGWTYDDDRYPKTEEKCPFAVLNAIKKCIKKNNYKFSGEEHQNMSYGAPVLNNGKKYSFSRRGWGEIMAQVWGNDNPFSYSSFTDALSLSKQVPKSGYNIQDFLSKKQLKEIIEINVNDEIYNYFTKNSIIYLYNNKNEELIETLNYLDNRDKLLIKNKNKTKIRSVAFVDYRLNDTEEDRIDFYKNYVCNTTDNELKKNALQKWQNIPMVLIIKFRTRKIKV